MWITIDGIHLGTLTVSQHHSGMTVLLHGKVWNFLILSLAVILCDTWQMKYLVVRSTYDFNKVYFEESILITQNKFEITTICKLMRMRNELFTIYTYITKYIYSVTRIHSCYFDQVFCWPCTIHLRSITNFYFNSSILYI